MKNKSTVNLPRKQKLNNRSSSFFSRSHIIDHKNPIPIKKIDSYERSSFINKWEIKKSESLDLVIINHNLLNRTNLLMQIK